METYIGCSGYYYNHWKKLFYPEDLPKNKWLPFYASHFNTVEINSSFYHMPLDNSLKNWYEITPPEFLFTLKGYRFITHLKKLHIDEALKEILNAFHRKARLLKNKLGCILWQLPGSQKLDLSKLESFCKLLDPEMKHVFEFRHESWFNKETYNILHQHNISFCMISAPGNLPDSVYTTSDVAYMRFHGKEGWYRDNYSNEELEKWGDKLMQLKAKKLFVYFNNDFNAFAVNNGLYFADILKKSVISQF